MDLKYLFTFWTFYLYNKLGTVLCQQFERHHQVFVEQGELQGVLYKFDEGHRVQMFYGVPYAKPPIGKLRFKKPEPLEHWNGKKHADTNYGPPCIQFLGFHLHDLYSKENMKKQSEDCLYLNIFAPYHDDKGRRHPVLVWIHGGSYLAGSGDTGMEKSAIIKNIVFKDVVLVTINYRLGPLGFMSYVDENGQRKGNFGLWDTIMALKWVQSSIRHFNGDADSVTIIGESAGASSVSALAVSPLTEGLFHRAIIMSGSVAANWAVFRPYEDAKPNWDIENVMGYFTCQKLFDHEIVTEILADYEKELYGECNLLPSRMYCNKRDSAGWLDCLRDHANFTDYFFNKIVSTENGVSKLVIDGEIITDHPEVMLKNFSRIPILIGVAESEWGHKQAPDYSFIKTEPITTEVAESRVYAAAMNFGSTMQPLPNTTLDLIANVTFFHYIEQTGHRPPYDMQMFVQTMRKIEADIDFVEPLHREARAYAENGNPVFVYMFEHVPDSDIIEDKYKTYDFFGVKKEVHFNKSVTHSKAFHGLDHGYLFTKGYSGNYQVENYGDEDEKMANFFSTLLTNFATFGNPTPKPVAGVEWTAYSADKPAFLHIQNAPFMEEADVGEESVRYWAGLGEYLTKFAAIDDPTAARISPLLDEERLELQAYKRAWWALWVLVAAIAIVLWTVVICMVAQKCCRAGQTGPKPNPHFIVASSQI